MFLYQINVPERHIVTSSNKGDVLLEVVVLYSFPILPSLDLVTRQNFPQYNDPGDPVAQLDRANGFEPLGSEFKSRRGRHLSS